MLRYGKVRYFLLKGAKSVMLNAYVSIMITQRRDLVAVRSDGLLLLYS